MSSTDLNKMEQNRRDALGKLKEFGIGPYPVDLYPVNETSQSIKDGYNAE